MSEGKFNFNDLKKAYVESSKGLAEFSEELCYHRGIIAHFHPLKVKDKKDLLKSLESKDQDVIERNLDRIIEKYVTFDGNISSEDITIQERYQLLTYIRRAAAGDEVKVVHKCPKCEEIVHDIPYDMNRMEVRKFDPDKELDNTIEVSKEIKLKLGPVNRKDQRQVDILISKNKAKSDSEKQIIALVGAIKEIELTAEDITSTVNLTPEEKLEFFMELDQNIIGKIADKIQIYDFGVKLPLNFKCPKCEYHNDEEEVNLLGFFIN